MYGSYYGDPGGLRIGVEGKDGGGMGEDLGGEAWGTGDGDGEKENWGGRVRAVWVVGR